MGNAKKVADRVIQNMICNSFRICPRQGIIEFAKGTKQ